MSEFILRAVLFLTGCVVVFLGVDMAFGGVLTLGLSGAGSFVAITDATVFGIQDNHVRFLAGFFMGAGVLMILMGVWLQRFAPYMPALAFMFLIGGLSRLSASGEIFSAPVELLPSFFAEIVLIPLLALWVRQATRSDV